MAQGLVAANEPGLGRLGMGGNIRIAQIVGHALKSSKGSRNGIGGSSRSSKKSFVTSRLAAKAKKIIPRLSFGLENHVSGQFIATNIDFVAFEPIGLW